MTITATQWNSEVSTTAVDKVANWLRYSIIRGELVAGMHVSETMVSKKLNVSATPVREAFRILQAENLLIHNGYSGVSVAAITPKYLHDICEMRKILDFACFDLIVDHITESDLAKLDEIIDELSSLAAAFCAQNIDAMESADYFDTIELGFHAIIARFTGNYEIEAATRNLCKKAHIFRLAILSNAAVSDRLKRTIVELKDIVKALRQKDKAMYESAVTIHYRRSESESQRLVSGG